jgi:hypothetical protein
VLVICVQTERGHHEIAGWCHAASIGDLLPTDMHDRGNWLSARLTLDRSQLHPGLPRFAHEAGAA